MENNVVIELEGVKITPEFARLVNNKFLKFVDNAGEFKAMLFDVQTSILIGIAKEQEVPRNLSDMTCALQDLNFFITDLIELRKEGKV